MSVIIGPPVSGDDFFGRKDIIDKLIKLLSRGISILLSGPRRVGKTSLALRLLKLLKKENWHCIYITVEGVHDVPSFVNRIVEGMKKEQTYWKKASDGFGKFFKDLNIDINLGPIKLSKKSDGIPETLLLEALGKSIQMLKENVFIVIDELPIFLRSLEKNTDSNISPAQVLECLRAMRQASITEENYKVIWMFSGSISLEHFASSRQLSYSISDIQSIKLSAFSEEDASQYIDYLSEKYQLTFETGVKDYILEKIQWHIPFYINILIDVLLDIKKDGAIAISIIDEAYSHGIDKYKKEFDYQTQRLVKDHDNAELYINILKQIAKHGFVPIDNIKAYLTSTEWKNTTEDGLLNILDLLEHDGYIIHASDGYTFRSPFLRDYIINKYHL